MISFNKNSGISSKNPTKMLKIVLKSYKLQIHHTSATSVDTSATATGPQKNH